MIYKYVDKYNVILGRYFFKNLNLFTYNLFNSIFKTFLFNKKSGYFKEFVQAGVQKVSKIPSKSIDELNSLLFLQEKITIENFNRGESFYDYEITPKIKDKVFDIVEGPLNKLFQELKIYYNTDIILSRIQIRRTFNTKSDKESYSNYFHSDGYTCMLQKIFINLQDISKIHGPLRYIKKTDAKKILKYNKPNINRIDNIEQLDLINHNVGQKGDVFLCNTTDLIHAAGVPAPGNKRDILFLEICALPKRNSNLNINYNIFDRKVPEESLTKAIAKPKGLRNLIKSFYRYY
tara:strand:- start:3059 stop:3931 length:873 start_codon:yes stop_codon:yes gene_type:complete